MMESACDPMYHGCGMNQGQGQSFQSRATQITWNNDLLSIMSIWLTVIICYRPQLLASESRRHTGSTAPHTGSPVVHAKLGM